MELLRRDPRKAYYSNVLSLPKTHISEMQLRGALTYELREKELYEAWTADRDHYLVPRNYIPALALAGLGFPVVDARIRRYPWVSFKSHVLLDRKTDFNEFYQREGVQALLDTQNGILCLRCGAGKSVCAIHAISLLHVPGLIVVNDLGLAKQWMMEIEEFTDLRKEDIGFIGDGRFDWEGKKLCVAAVQTLASRVRSNTLPRELVEWFGVVVADEAHNTSGPAFYHLAMTPFHGRRWGLSATPNRNDGFNSLLRYTIGGVVYKYLMPELTPLIYFRRLPTKINMRDPDVFAAVCDVTGELHLNKMYGYLATREDRTKTIIAEAKEAIRQGRHVLLLSQSKAMVKRLAEAFPSPGLVHGGVDMDARHGLVQDCNPVIAISKLGRQALNKPILDTLMICEPYTDAGVLQQLIGRIQRPEPNKQRPMAVFYDDIHVERMHAMLKKVKRLFDRWPEDQGGRLKWQVTGTE